MTGRYADACLQIREAVEILSGRRGTKTRFFVTYFCVSRQTVIELKAGESIELSGTYGPTDYYRNATVEFTTADGEMVHMEGNTLVADEAGETYLRVYVAPFGGVKLIRLRISSENKPLDPEPADDKKPADSRNANTADSNNIPLYKGILGASLLAAIALIMYKRKQTN